MQILDLPVSQRAHAIPAPGTATMRGRADALRTSGRRIINLAAGELTIHTSDAIKRAAMAAIDRGCNRYTSPLGLPELRRRLAARVSLDCGVEYAAAEVAVTAGAKQALFNAAMLLLNPADEAIVPCPYWETFPSQVVLAGGIPVLVDTARSNYRLRLEDVERRLSPATKLLIVNTPNNPTGAVYDADCLYGLAELALDRGIWIVFDECYARLVRRGSAHYNIVSLCPAVKQQTVVVNSFSKSHALTGWRIGYVAGPARFVEAMGRLQGHTTSNANTISQHAVDAALDDGPDPFVVAVNQHLDAQLERILPIAREIEDVSHAPPDGAFYLYLNVSRKLGRRYHGRAIVNVDELTEELLSASGVAVVPGSSFGDLGSIRVSYAVDADDAVAGMQATRDFLNAMA
jgi:aspartate aminotransferase